MIRARTEPGAHGWLLLAVLLALLPAARSIAATPVHDADVQRLAQRLSQLEADPALGDLADGERLKAHQSLDAMAATPPRSRERGPAQYIAQRRVAAAEFAAQAEMAERQLDQLDREHDRILLEASRRDADQARKEAERLRLQATLREEEAQRAAADHAAQAEQEAGIATELSAEAQGLAEARAKQVELEQQRAALMAGTPAASDRRASMVLPGAAFAPGSATLKQDARTRAAVQGLVAFARAHPTALLHVEGHTDNQGNPRTNLDLSRQRAEAVRALLRASGVPANRLQAAGLGAEQPVAPNTTAQGRERNRRVEVIATPDRN